MWRPLGQPRGTTRLDHNAEQLVSKRSAASGQESAVAFARCMRSDGVPGWPDPNSYGGFDKSKLTQRQLGAGNAQVGAAQRACRHLLPTSSATQQQTQRIVAQALRFSRCVRNHGITNFPDPDSNGGTSGTSSADQFSYVPILISRPPATTVPTVTPVLVAPPTRPRPRFRPFRRRCWYRRVAGRRRRRPAPGIGC